MKYFIGILFSLLVTTSNLFAQCEVPNIKYHPFHADVDDTAKYWFSGVGFRAFSLDGLPIGWSPIPSKYRSVRSGYFPLHVYGDDFLTAQKEGPIDGEEFFIHSNIIKNCGELRTDHPAIFKNWSNIRPGFKHPGDVNNDKIIDMVDYKAVQRAIMMYKYFYIYQCQYDVNGDGVIDANDGGLVGRVVLYGDPKSTIGKWGYGCQTM